MRDKIKAAARRVADVLLRTARKAAVAALIAGLGAVTVGLSAGLDWRAVAAIAGSKALAAGVLVWKTENVGPKIVDATEG